jgi:membrane protein DedA with SNARE-associated domain
LTQQVQSYGLILVFALVAVEGVGVPLPGETALIAGAILASQHKFSIEAVIAVAAAGAIAGDNTGYWLGRLGGRRLLERLPVVSGAVTRVLPRAERFFERQGTKTVFIARFVAILRITVAWLAGISRMPWRRFFAFDAAGAILWSVAVGSVAYVFGRAAADAIGHYGVEAAIVVAAAVVLGALFVYFRRRRRAV